MVLATRPRLLLLDEPMAGMGLEESQRMIELLRTLKGAHTMLLVEHDMDAVFALADRISVMVYGRIIASGPPEEIRVNAEVREAYLGEDARADARGARRSRPPTARARCSSASTSRCAPARSSRCSAATAWARRRRCARSWASCRRAPARCTSTASGSHGLPSYRVAQRGLGLVPEGRQVFPTLTVRENLVATAANRLRLGRPVDGREGLRAVPAARRARARARRYAVRGRAADARDRPRAR